MKRKSRKLVSCFAATVLCLTMLFGVTVQAGTLNPRDYFCVTVATEIVIGRAGQPVKTGDFGGTIEGWNQVVAAGSRVGASLSRRSGTDISKPYPENVSYKWKLVDESGTYTKLMYGSSINIPTQFAGGYLEAIVTIGADDTWTDKEFGTRVSID